MTEIYTQATFPYWAEAEMAYRLERARRAYGSGPRRHRVRRRPSLKLPLPRRRPLAVA